MQLENMNLLRQVNAGVYWLIGHKTPLPQEPKDKIPDYIIEMVRNVPVRPGHYRVVRITWWPN